jgi:hypothetical protein
MKSYVQKNRDKTRAKKGKTKGDKKNQIKKGEKIIKRQVKKVKSDRNFFDKKTIKEKEPKIKVLTHELLASTLSYIMLEMN